MLDLMIKILKTVWPFIMELIVGKHMSVIQGMKKHPWKTVTAGFLTLLIPWSVFSTYQLYTVAKAAVINEKKITQLSAELNSLKGKTNRIAVTQASAIEAGTAVLNNQKDVNIDLAKQLEELRKIK